MASSADWIPVADPLGMDCTVKKRKIRKRSTRVESHPDRLVDASSRLRLQIEAAIRRIPKGKVSTYGAVARAAGLGRGARFVARTLQRGFGLPWQRVLGAGGEIKLRGDSAIEQRLRLEAEGVRFRGRKVDLKQCEFRFTRTTKGRGARRKAD